jgi:hypothetical protein
LVATTIYFLEIIGVEKPDNDGKLLVILMHEFLLTSDRCWWAMQGNLTDFYAEPNTQAGHTCLVWAKICALIELLLRYKAAHNVIFTQ